MSVEQASRDYSARVVDRSNKIIGGGITVATVGGIGAVAGVASENPIALVYSVGLGLLGLGAAAIGRWLGRPERAQVRRIDAVQAARKAAK